MATCTLIFEDTEDGEVTANVRMLPVPDAPGGSVTPVQSLGMRLLEASFGVLTDMEAEATP